MQMIVHGFPSRLVRNTHSTATLYTFYLRLLSNSNGLGNILTGRVTFATKTVACSETVGRSASKSSSSTYSKWETRESYHKTLLLERIVHTMITRHPFNTWPLHVKLFTEEAVNLWKAASSAKSAPPGFTCSVELEGVDGKSGHSGTGRKGPIAVDDGRSSRFIHASLQNLPTTFVHKLNLQMPISPNILHS